MPASIIESPLTGTTTVLDGTFTTISSIEEHEVVAVGECGVRQAGLHRVRAPRAARKKRRPGFTGCPASSQIAASSKRFTHSETQDLAEMPQSAASTEYDGMTLCSA
jgi:hypothetical protein